MSSILIVDDENDFCDLLSHYLEKEGYEVRAATSAAEALSGLDQDQPDLILMDVRIPDTSGLELLPQIKSICPRSYVVVVTALNDYRIADILYELGADGFLTKPVRLEIISETVRRFLPNPTAC